WPGPPRRSRATSGARASPSRSSTEGRTRTSSALRLRSTPLRRACRPPVWRRSTSATTGCRLDAFASRSDLLDIDWSIDLGSAPPASAHEGGRGVRRHRRRGWPQRADVRRLSGPGREAGAGPRGPAGRRRVRADRRDRGRGARFQDEPVCHRARPHQHPVVGRRGTRPRPLRPALRPSRPLGGVAAPRRCLHPVLAGPGPDRQGDRGVLAPGRRPLRPVLPDPARPLVHRRAVHAGPPPPSRTRRSLAPGARIALQSPAQVIEEWFEGDEIKAALGCYAACSMASIDEPGTGILLSVTAVTHEWGARRCVGGAGEFTQALARFVVAHGGDVRAASPVREIVVRNGRAQGVVLDDGVEITGEHVVAALAPTTLLTKLLDPSVVPDQTWAVLRGMQVCHNNISVGKVDVA